MKKRGEKNINITPFLRHTMVLNALLGIHDPDLRDGMKRFLQNEEYQVEIAMTPAEILEMATRRSYALIAMDLNFGDPGSDNISIGTKVYHQVEEDVKAGRTNYVGISGNQEAVEAARREHTPAYGKPFPLAVLLGDDEKKISSP